MSEDKMTAERTVQLLLIGELLKKGMSDKDWVTKYHQDQASRRRSVSLNLGLLQFSTFLVIFAGAFVGASGHNLLAWVTIGIGLVIAAIIGTTAVHNRITELRQSDTHFITKIIAQYICEQTEEMKNDNQSSSAEQLELPISELPTMQAPPGKN